jgi:hypothetical protein
MSALNYNVVAGPYSVDPADLQDVLNPVRTTAQLAALVDPINTTDKFAGRCVFDSTKGQPVWADGPLVGDTWSLSTGIVASTPA